MWNHPVLISPIAILRISSACELNLKTTQAATTNRLKSREIFSLRLIDVRWLMWFFMNQNGDKMRQLLLLNDLNDDVLSMIFDMCSLDDLLQLYYTCKRFQFIIGQSIFLRRSFDLLLVGHRNRNAVSYQRWAIEWFCPMHFPPNSFSISVQYRSCHTTSEWNCFKTGATADTKSISCSINPNSIHHESFWKRSIYSNHTAANWDNTVARSGKVKFYIGDRSRHMAKYVTRTSHAWQKTTEPCCLAVAMAESKSSTWTPTRMTRSTRPTLAPPINPSNASNVWIFRVNCMPRQHYNELHCGKSAMNSICHTWIHLPNWAMALNAFACHPMSIEWPWANTRTPLEEAYI